ncbi:MAG: membrane protein insertase YidC [Succinivibrionaceae bacterium]|nr:membrane protein insertase YidC [Succinivibrionaceae bacterium]
MEQQRNILLAIFLILSLFLYWNWESDKIQAAKRASEVDSTPAAAEAALAESVSSGQVVKLRSDSLDLAISLTGGDIVDAKLLKIKQTQDKDDPFHLMVTGKNFIYQVQSGLTGRDGPDAKARPTFTAPATEFTLKDGENEVSADLTFSQDGVTYHKIFTLRRDSYVVSLRYEIDNQGPRDLEMSLYGQLKQTAEYPQEEMNAFGFVASAYRGTAYSTEEARYEKETLDSLVDLARDNNRLNVATKGGWVSMIQHYFVGAWIGDPNGDNVIYSNASSDHRDAIIGMHTKPVGIAAKSSQTLSAQLWIGPKEQEAMSAVSPNLDLTVDYGWLWFISVPLYHVLEFLHSFIGNWGFSIIALTLIVRGLMFPLTKAQYTSMAKMRLLTPKMQEIKERYKDDRQKIGQETMKLYREEKVNPMGGCLPILIQMPIFIALYWTLMESTELRQAPFILWITDLSVYDPYFITPILYGITMFGIQKMSPNPISDPIQRKIFMAMPFVFTLMFCMFPAGLTVYWLVSNCFTIFQQFVIYRSLEKRGLSMKIPVTPQKKQ